MHELEYQIGIVLKRVKWDERRIRNGAILNPSGDGYFIGFDNFISDDDVLGFASELSSRLDAKGVPIRVGINKGPCFVYLDLNSKLNLCGWGIIDAERVMSCGDKNHILCTYEFAHEQQNRHSNPNLTHVGTADVKGRQLIVYNYAYTDQFGNCNVATIKNIMP